MSSAGACDYVKKLPFNIDVAPSGIKICKVLTSQPPCDVAQEVRARPQYIPTDWNSGYPRPNLST